MGGRTAHPLIVARAVLPQLKRENFEPLMAAVSTVEHAHNAEPIPPCVPPPKPQRHKGDDERQMRYGQEPGQIRRVRT
jgi:hypothetical protein